MFEEVLGKGGGDTRFWTMDLLIYNKKILFVIKLCIGTALSQLDYTMAVTDLVRQNSWANA